MSILIVMELESKSVFKIESGSGNDATEFEHLKGLAAVFSLEGFLLLKARFFSFGCLFLPRISQYHEGLVQSLYTAKHSEQLLSGFAEARAALEEYHQLAEWRRLLFWVCMPALVTIILLIFGYLYLTLYLRLHRSFYREAVVFYESVESDGYKEASRKYRKNCVIKWRADGVTWTQGDTSHSSFTDFSKEEVKRLAHEKVLSFTRAFEHRLLGMWHTVTLAQLSGSRFRRQFRVDSEPLVLLMAFVSYPYLMQAFARPLNCSEPLMEANLARRSHFHAEL